MKRFFTKKYIVLAIFLVFLFSNGAYTIFINPALDSDIKLIITFINLFMGSIVGIYYRKQ